MCTTKIYQNNPYKKDEMGTILSVNYDEKTVQIILNQTIFFPTGGGQSCDRGTIILDGISYPVIDVREEENDVVHVLEIPSGNVVTLEEGQTVSMHIDWDHRFDNMQRHCGEHILSGAIYRLFHGHNKGFHMGEDEITIDIAFDEDSTYSKMSWTMAEEAEREVNQVIQANLPVYVDYFETREDAEQYPLRKPLAFDEDISIVTIGDRENPADCVACCGTHPATTGQIGLLKIYKIEPNKGMSRIYFECGNRALHIYEKQFNVLYELGNKLSSGYQELLDKYDAQEKHNAELREQLRNFRNQALAATTKEILASVQPKATYRFDQYSVDDLFNLGKGLEGQLPGMIALIHTPSNTVILLSDADKKSPEELQCGALIKAHGAKYGGKGGGKPSSARVFFPDAENMSQFLVDMGFHVD